MALYSNILIFFLFIIMSEEVKYISKIRIEDNDYNIKDDNVREAVGYYEEEVLVDLGLPSGTLWAKTNIGADSETDFGLYFAWGETEGYPDAYSGKSFLWADYKYGTSYNNITKYNNSDGLTQLTNEDDAAYANSDGLLRMPTQEECEELMNYTDNEWATINGINGSKFTNRSDSSKYIFIPAAGWCISGSIKNVGSYCYLKSSSRFLNASGAWCLYCVPDRVFMSYNDRCIGLCVRGVSSTYTTKPKSTKADKVKNCQPGNFPALDSTGNLVDSGVSKESLSNQFYKKNQNILIDETGIYQVKDTSVYPASHPDLSTQPSILPQRYGNLDINEVLIANGRESEIPNNAMVISAFSFNQNACVPAVCEKDKEIIVREEDRVLSVINPNDENLVDLGLPSGTLWAKKNLGASSETDYGLYFAWGETTGYPDASQKAFSWDDYKYGTSSNITKYNDSDGLTQLGTSDDAVFFDSDEMYVMPTKEQLEELMNYTNSEWTTINGISGRKFTNKNDSSKYIFVPAAGRCDNGSVNNVGSSCYLWSSSRCSYANNAWRLYCDSYEEMYFNNRCLGLSVRGVGRTYTNFKVTPQNLLDNLTLQNKTNDEVLNKVLSGNSLHFTSQDGTTIDGFIDIINNQPTFVNTNHPELVKYTYIDPEKIPITKVIPGWSIYNFMNIVPEFTLVQYVGTDNGSYYYYPSGGDSDSGGGDDFIIPEFIDEDDGELVDLGLPSGTLWAKSNLGASSPSQHGLYYAWGETEGYTDASSGKAFSWDDYKYGTSYDNITKYNYSDGLTQLEISDDAVYQATNGNLVMPTQEQMKELNNNTYSVWYTTQIGIKGRMFISKVDNSKYIFIPDTSYCINGSVIHIMDACYLWSSSRNSIANGAQILCCQFNEVNTQSYSRCCGVCVRGVGRTQ